MRKLLTFFIYFMLGASAFAAFIITCPSKGINALNQSGQYTTQVNGVNQTQVFDNAYYDNLYQTNDCIATQVNDNEVYITLNADQIAQQQEDMQQKQQLQQLIEDDKTSLAIQDLENQGLITGGQATQASSNLTTLNTAQNNIKRVSP